MSDFETESRLWDMEVDRIAAEMVRKGYPPYIAKRLASEQVQRDRWNRLLNSVKGSE